MANTRPQAVTLARPAWSVQMANAVMQRGLPFQWHYDQGLALQAIEQVWQKTGDAAYLVYVKNAVERFVSPTGGIKTYTVEEYNLDQVNPGKVLFRLYRATGDERYKKAIYLLREQLKGQPRTSEGGFWHKKIYPYQMWLDGIYMASPFYAEFATTFDEPAAFDDLAKQVILIEKHTRDPQTGLLYHGWDESRQQRWANPETGCSPHFWGRGLGWYAMALVDILDHLPADHHQRESIVRILDRTVAAVAKVQDASTGLWYQVLDQGGREGNYLEASASCMFVYAIAKGVRKEYLSPRYADVARRAYRGIHGNFVEIDDQGLANLNWVCGGAGLGGDPYRDGSYGYYVGERIVSNDYKGVGPFILASVELEALRAVE